MTTDRPPVWELALLWAVCIIAAWAIVAFIVWLAFPIFGVTL